MNEKVASLSEAQVGENSAAVLGCGTSITAP